MRRPSQIKMLYIVIVIDGRNAWLRRLGDQKPPGLVRAILEFKSARRNGTVVGEGNAQGGVVDKDAAILIVSRQR